MNKQGRNIGRTEVLGFTHLMATEGQGHAEKCMAQVGEGGGGGGGVKSFLDFGAEDADRGRGRDSGGSLDLDLGSNCTDRAMLPA